MHYKFATATLALYAGITLGQQQDLESILDSYANATKSSPRQERLYSVDIARAVLSSPCGRQFLTRYQSILNSTQQRPQQSQPAVFVPVDESFGSLGQLVRTGIFRLDCTGGESCTANPFVPIITEGRQRASSIVSCLPDLLAYHLVPNMTVSLNQTSASGGNGGNQTVSGQQQQQPPQQGQQWNVTVLETALNSTGLVQLSQNGSIPQVVLLNSTDNSYWLDFGYGRRGGARILKPNIQQQGPLQQQQPQNQNTIQVHLIDTVLIPPLPLNITLQLANLTEFASALNQTLNSTGGSQGRGFGFGRLGRFANQQQQPQSNNTLAGITVFAPLNSAFQQNQTSFNATRYIIPNQVLYANQTLFSAGSLNVTNAANETIPITVGSSSRNQTNQTSQEVDLTAQQQQQQNITFGNATVVYPNILIAEGVLHIIDNLI